MPPPPPPQNNNNNNNKKPWSHGLGSRRSFVFQTETSDTKYVIFSFILDFPFLLAVRISLLLFLYMKYTQITLSRREKERQNGKVESHEELKGTPPLFLLFLLPTPSWRLHVTSSCWNFSSGLAVTSPPLLSSGSAYISTWHFTFQYGRRLLLFCGGNCKNYAKFGWLKLCT